MAKYTKPKMSKKSSKDWIKEASQSDLVKSILKRYHLTKPKIPVDIDSDKWDDLPREDQLYYLYQYLDWQEASLGAELIGNKLSKTDSYIVEKVVEQLQDQIALIENDADYGKAVERRKKSSEEVATVIAQADIAIAKMKQPPAITKPIESKIPAPIAESKPTYTAPVITKPTKPVEKTEKIQSKKEIVSDSIKRPRQKWYVFTLDADKGDQYEFNSKTEAQNFIRSGETKWKEKFFADHSKIYTDQDSGKQLYLIPDASISNWPEHKKRAKQTSKKTS